MSRVLRDPVADRRGPRRSSRSCSPCSTGGIPTRRAGYLFEDIRRNSVWFAFVVALGHDARQPLPLRDRALPPVPAVLVPADLHVPARRSRSLVGGIRRDRMVWTYVLPPAIIGAGFAIYHTQLQAYPAQHGPFCKINDPCTIRYVWEFGFVSIPFMALAAFAFIITMMFVLRSEPIRSKTSSTSSNPPTRRASEDAPPFPPKEPHEQAARSQTSAKRRPQARKGRTAAAAKSAAEGHRPHRVDHRGDRDRRSAARSCSCSPSGRTRPAAPTRSRAARRRRRRS